MNPERWASLLSQKAAELSTHTPHAATHSPAANALGASLVDIKATHVSRFSKALVLPGTNVRSGQAIAQLRVLGTVFNVQAPQEGILLEWDAQPGQAVEYGQVLAKLQPSSPRR